MLFIHYTSRAQQTIRLKTSYVKYQTKHITYSSVGYLIMITDVIQTH